MPADMHNPTASAAGGIRHRLSALAANPAIRGMAGVFLLKGSMIAMNFALIALAARVLDTDGFGVYSILYSAVGLFGIVATAGQQMLIMRMWNEYAAANDGERLKGALLYSLGALAIGTMVAAVGFAIWAERTYGTTLAVAVVAYLVFYAVIQTTNHLVRTAVNVTVGDGIGNFIVYLPAVAALACALASGAAFGVADLLLVLAAGSAAGIAIHAVVVAYRLKTVVPGFARVRARFEWREWNTRSFKLWISTALEASNQYLDVLIIGYLMSPAVAGAYFITTRIANIFAAASDSVNMFSTRHIPDLYYRGERADLQALLRSVGGLTLAVIGAGMVGVIGAGYWLLLFINPAYAAYFPALVVLCAGTAIAAAAGPTASLLMLTGHEGRYLAIIAASGALRAVGFFVLIPPFGILGAVTASALSFATMAVLLRQSAVRLTGLDASVLAWLGPQPHAVVAAE